jgi:hypothetical protein
MHHKTFLLSTIIILLGFAFISFQMSCIKPMSESEVDQSIGMNGSFEYTKNCLPINWLVYTSKTTPSGTFTIQADTTIKKEGKQSLHFVVKECSVKGGWYSPGIAQEIAVHEGEKYLIQAWIKNKQSTMVLKVNAVDAKHEAEVTETFLSENYNEWHLVEMRYTIPENMKRLRLELNVLKPGECWVDEIRITKTN